jgi:hypothetical protein
MMDMERWKEARERGDRWVWAVVWTGPSRRYARCPSQSRREPNRGCRRTLVDLSARLAFPTQTCDGPPHRKPPVTAMSLVCMVGSADTSYRDASGVGPATVQRATTGTSSDCALTH